MLRILIRSILQSTYNICFFSVEKKRWWGRFCGKMKVGWVEDISIFIKSSLSEAMIEKYIFLHKCVNVITMQ